MRDCVSECVCECVTTSSTTRRCMCMAAILSLQVSHVGEDVERIPSQVVVKFAKTAKRLDLSYNRIK